MSLNEDDTESRDLGDFDQSRDLGDFEYLINDQQDYDNCSSLVSDEDAVFRSIPMSAGPLDMDMSGFGYEAHGPTKTLGDYSGLQDTFAKQRPDLMPHTKSATSEPIIFNIVEAASAPPSLSKDMCCVVSKQLVFFEASNINQITACVRYVIEEHDCFEAVAMKDDFADMGGPEASKWVWNLTHYSRAKFSIELNVIFWALDDSEGVRHSFPACPQGANFAVEFQRLGGDSFAWMDLWSDLLGGIEQNSQASVMRVTRNANPTKRRCLDMDLLSDSEDDEGDDEVGSSLTMLMGMCSRSGLEGQLEGLKAMCRMCENAGQCKQMGSNAEFLKFVAKTLGDINEDCQKSSRPTPLLRCAVSLLMSLVGTSGGKDLVGANESVMGVVAFMLEDSACCQAVRYECAKMVLYMVSHGVDFASRDVVLEAVTAGVSEVNGRKLNETLTQVQNKVRSLTYR